MCADPLISRMMRVPWSPETNIDVPGWRRKKVPTRFFIVPITSELLPCDKLRVNRMTKRSYRSFTGRDGGGF